MTDSWLNALDKGEMIGVVLVDFKKAFDLVDHDILLTKLELYGKKIKHFIGSSLIYHNGNNKSQVIRYLVLDLYHVEFHKVLF